MFFYAASETWQNVCQIKGGSKQAVQKLDGERFNLRKLKDLKVKKQLSD